MLEIVADDAAPSRDLLRAAAARYAAVDAHALPGALAHYVPGSFDVAVCFALERLTDPVGTLGAIVPLLRSDGCAIVAARSRRVADDAAGLHFHAVRDLLLGYFPHVRVCAQRRIAASAIRMPDQARAATAWVDAAFDVHDDLGGIGEADAFVAVCGRQGAVVSRLLNSVYFDERADLPVTPAAPAEPPVRIVVDDTALAGSRAETERERARCAQLEERIVALERERDAARASLDDHASLAVELAEERDRRRAAERRIAAADLERFTAVENAEAAERALQSLVGSRTWRMTAPLRRLMHVVRKRP